MMNRLVAFFAFCVVTALAEVEIDRLFHANPPSLTSNVNQPAQNVTQDDKRQQPDAYVPFSGSRHDEFDFALLKKVLTADDKNAVISPFLIKTLLSILAEASGPQTITHRELASVTPSLATIEEIRQHYGAAFGSLLTPNPDYELTLGAKMYVDKFITPRQKFASIMKAFYHSDIETVDFSRSKESAQIINAWCSNATKNYIKNIVTEDDVNQAVILLINTIYFNGFWSKPFLDNKTTLDNFYVNSKENVRVPFMHRIDEFDYAYIPEILPAQLLRLPYKGGKYAMFIILPDQRDNIDEFVAKIDSAVLHRLQHLMEEVEVTVSLPKFRIVNTVHLNEILKALGIRQMFTLQASFPQMVRGAAVTDRLQVSTVLQKTGIDVNERGSTAYAAGLGTLVNKFGGEIIFKADHPFLFIIEDENTGTILFTGKITKPEYESNS